MSKSAITKVPPSTLAPVQTTEEARASLAASRDRLLRQLDSVKQEVETVRRAVQTRIEPFTDWRAYVKRHPLATLGATFLAGYALARLFSRK